MKFVEKFFERFAKLFPDLREKLWKAGIYKESDEYLKESFMSAFILLTVFLILVFLFFSNFAIFKNVILLMSLPIIFLIILAYFVSLPNALILQRSRLIDKDIVSTGRQILVQIKSGVPLYDVIKNISELNGEIAIPFKEVANKVSLGTDLEDAIAETMKMTPSEKLKRLFSQMLNALKTGAELTVSISSLLDQVTKEQLIEIKKYGRKLNPIAMFYMLVAVIVPTLGITILIIVSSFLSLDINLFILFTLLTVITLIQIMFMSVIKRSRPLIDL